jgi:hypothetical protein
LTPAVQRRVEAIIGGEAADQTGFAQITHVNGDKTCSGTLIASELVVTAKHCVLRSTSDGVQALSPEGFRIEFGSAPANFVRRTADAVTWIDASDALDIETAVATGQDVAVLQLSEPAPDLEIVRDVALDFVPAADAGVYLVGFGISDLQTGRNGERMLGEGRISGFDPDTGIVQVSGDSICFGDSGGAVLNAEFERVLGVLGEVGGSSQNEFCDIGISFAATAANADVRRLLAKECARVGGCGRSPAVPPIDAGMDAGQSISDSGALKPEAGASAQDAAVERNDAADMPGEDAAMEREKQNAGSCATRTARGGGTVHAWWLAITAGLLLRRHRRRAASSVRS